MPGTRLSQSDPQHPPKPNVARVLEKAGIAKLRAGHYKAASRIFNAGLKFEPTNADLNFFNGLTYQLRYLRGNQAMLGLATVGYELALRYNPAHYYAALQLGRLQFEAKRYNKATTAFQRALDIRPESGAAYLGLASADYYARKLRHARVAADKAASLMPHSAGAARAQAMIYAALGEAAKAKAASVHYAALEKNPFARARLDRRLHEWHVWHASFPAQSVADTAAQDTPPPTQTSASPNSGSSAPTGSSSSSSSSSSAGSAPSSSTGMPEVFSPGSNAGAPTASSPVSNSGIPTGSSPSPISNAPQQRTARQPWYECNGSGGNQGAGFPGGSAGPSGYGGGSGYGSGDGTTDLPALPSPCVGAPAPRMVVLDVVFVQTENNASSSYGINLLQGLNFVFGLSRVSTVNEPPSFGSSRKSIQVIRNASLGGSDFQSQIAYSLNIMNSTNDRTQVLSKPSLIALDRMPSTFFSGANLTVGVVGGAGSYNSIENQPVGTNLSVTPTFIGKNKLLLAVRAERSFLSPIDLNVNFQQAYQTSRNVISADVVLKMGQTLILSGLSEDERERISNGVPVLKDIPALQYLFNNTTTETFTKSVLVLITPRPATTAQAVMKKVLHHTAMLTATERRYAPLIEKQMRASHGGVPANLPSTYAHAINNTLFLQFRTGDLSLQHWSDPSRLSRVFKQLGNALYYANQ